MEGVSFFVEPANTAATTIIKNYSMMNIREKYNIYNCCKMHKIKASIDINFIYFPDNDCIEIFFDYFIDELFHMC